MNGLILLAVIAGVALLATSSAKASTAGTGLPSGPGGLGSVATTRADGTVVFTRDTAVAIWRALKSHAYAVDPTVPGRIQVAPEASGSPLPAGKSATDWALDKNATLPLLVPLYMAFDSKGPRYVRATSDLSIAKTGGVYALLAEVGEAAAIDAEATDTPAPTPIEVGKKTDGGPIVSGGGTTVPSGGVGPSGLPSVHETTDYDLVQTDVDTGPVAFASRAGYDTLDAFLADNPQLSKVVPPTEGWPPLGFLAVAIGDHAVGYTGTGRLAKGTAFPTYTKKGDAVEVYFPHWVDAVLGDDPDTGMTNVVWHNVIPVEAKAGSEGKIYGEPSTIDPAVTNHGAIVPWFVGQTVKIQKAHPLINL